MNKNNRMSIGFRIAIIGLITVISVSIGGGLEAKQEKEPNLLRKLGDNQERLGDVFINLIKDTMRWPMLDGRAIP